PLRAVPGARRGGRPAGRRPARELVSGHLLVGPSKFSHKSVVAGQRFCAVLSIQGGPMRISLAKPNLQLNPKLQLRLPGKKGTGGGAGLDTEAGSIAATEVAGANGDARIAASAIAPLEPGAFHEGEVMDADRLSAALKRLFSEHKLSKQVRVGIGNQRVV